MVPPRTPTHQHIYWAQTIAPLSHVVAVAHQHDQVLRGIVETLRGLTANVAQIESQLNPAPTHHSPSASGPPAPTPPSDMPVYVPREPHVPAPERYDGDLGTCRHWSMMSFGTFSIVLCLFTWMTFSSSPGTWRNTPSMSDSAPGPLPACLPACLLWGPLPPTPSCLPLPFSLTPLSPPVLGLSLLHPHSIHLNSPPNFPGNKALLRLTSL
ncbi:uncharacterized protein [Thunnus thynnus]|uniref:uncharacterized protein n=1 Tax=Thunnus thynnus TaxID=8237 RepID=UPI003528B292